MQSLEHGNLQREVGRQGAAEQDLGHGRAVCGKKPWIWILVVKIHFKTFPLTEARLGILAHDLGGRRHLEEAW